MKKNHVNKDNALANNKSVKKMNSLLTDLEKDILDWLSSKQPFFTNERDFQVRLAMELLKKYKKIAEKRKELSLGYSKGWHDRLGLQTINRSVSSGMS